MNKKDFDTLTFGTIVFWSEHPGQSFIITGKTSWAKPRWIATRICTSENSIPESHAISWVHEPYDGSGWQIRGIQSLEGIYVYHN
jgi:hypothetical protein